MKILFCSGHPFQPQMFGGMQSSTNTLARHLIERGHDVALVCGLSAHGIIAWRDRVIMKFFRKPAARDNRLGYPVWRSWIPAQAIGYVAGRFKPDLVVIAPPNAVPGGLVIKAMGIPVLMWLLDVEMDKHGADFIQLGSVPGVSNSSYTSKKYYEIFGLETVVIHPLMDRDNYLTETVRKNVTFINPHLHKGLDIVLAVAAACSEIPFAIYESWTLSAEERAGLHSQLAALPNVALFPSTNDMRSVYRKTRILLAPSRWNEAYGRVISEAQFNGIPAVASNRGGLPETVGPGGVILDPDGPIEAWVSEIKRLWHDEDYYAQMSRAALSYAARPAIDLDKQLVCWEETLAAAIAVK